VLVFFVQDRLLTNVTTGQSAIRHDLILALYCRFQRPKPSLDASEEDLDFCLPVAVQLAGGGRDATLQDRRIGSSYADLACATANLTRGHAGYRACDELFTELPHSLKLLLINTIRAVRPLCSLSLPFVTHVTLRTWTLPVMIRRRKRDGLWDSEQQLHQG
jgi:hypothetical protein